MNAVWEGLSNEIISTTAVIKSLLKRNCALIKNIIVSGVSNQSLKSMNLGTERRF